MIKNQLIIEQDIAALINGIQRKMKAYYNHKLKETEIKETYIVGQMKKTGIKIPYIFARENYLIYQSVLEILMDELVYHTLTREEAKQKLSLLRNLPEFTDDDLRSLQNDKIGRLAYNIENTNKSSVTTKNVSYLGLIEGWTFKICEFTSEQELKHHLLTWTINTIRECEEQYLKHSDSKDIRLENLFTKGFLYELENVGIDIKKEIIDYHNENIIYGDFQNEWEIEIEVSVQVDKHEFLKNKENTDHPAYTVLQESDMDDNGLLTYTRDIVIDFDDLDPLNFTEEKINKVAEESFDKIMYDEYQDDKNIPLVFGGVDYGRTFKVIRAEFQGMHDVLIYDKKSIQKGKSSPNPRKP
jgi:hypothetical protein